MSNRVVFNLVVERAKEKQAYNNSLVRCAKIEVPTGVILYAAQRIAELEALVEFHKATSNK